MGLFSPAWMSKKPEKAVAALSKLTEEEQYFRVVMEARVLQARLIALEHLQQEELLCRIVQKLGLPDEIRYQAFKRIRSDELLEKIAVDSIYLYGPEYSYAISRDAAAKMNSSTRLSRVIKDAVSEDVRAMAAKRKLYVNSFESSALFSLLIATQDANMIAWGIERIHTQDELYRLAKSAAAEKTRVMATERLCYACLVRLVVENASRTAMSMLLRASPEHWQEYTDRAFVDRILISVLQRSLGATPDALEFQLLRRLYTVEEKAALVLEEVRHAKLYNAFAAIT